MSEAQSRKHQHKIEKDAHQHNLQERRNNFELPKVTTVSKCTNSKEI